MISLRIIKQTNRFISLNNQDLALTKYLYSMELRLK